MFEICTLKLFIEKLKTRILVVDNGRVTFFFKKYFYSTCSDFVTVPLFMNVISCFLTFLPAALKRRDEID